MSFPAVQTHLIRSRVVAQTFKIQVMLPARKQGESTRFPVVYATDGNATFDVLKGISYSMQSLEQDAPRFILVGIGYPGDSPVAGALLRARDFTFPGGPRFNIEPLPIEGVLMAEPGSKDYYGAADFCQFIEQELIPLIDERYESVVGDRTYFGHSAGGSLGLFTLFTRATLFNNYIISSPGLSYEGEFPAGVRHDNRDFVAEQARRCLASGKVLAGIRLYMSVGSEEEFEPACANWQLTSSFFRMAALLRQSNIPGLQLITEVFRGETHNTVWPMAFIHGIQATFERGVWRREEGSCETVKASRL